MSDLPVVSRRGMRKGQASLFDLITEKLATNQSVTLAEARNIWVEQVCMHLIDGKPHGYRLHYGSPAHDGTGTLIGYGTKLQPLSQEEIDFNTMNWLTKNIGLLVMRGYLKVIPQIQLEAGEAAKETE